MDFQEYLEIITKRKWIILIIALIIPLTTFVKLKLTTPIYEASTMIIFEDQQELGLGDILGEKTSFGRRPNLSNQIELIRSTPIIKQVIDTLNLKDKADKPLSPYAILKDIDIKSVRNTSIIEIKYKNSDKVSAAKILQSLAETTVINNVVTKKQNLGAAKQFIKNQLLTRQDRLLETETRIMLFDEKNSSFSLKHEITQYLSELSSITTEKIKMESQLRALEEKEKLLQEKILKNSSAPLSLLMPWKNELQPISMVKLALVVQLKSLNDEIYLLTQKLKRMAPKEFQYSRLERELDIENEIYTNFIRNLEKLKLQEAAQVPDMRIIEPAVTKSKPVYPTPGKTIPISFAIGIILGFGVAIALEYFDNRLRTPKEIEKITGWPKLGIIPLIQEIDDTTGRTESLIKLSPKSQVTESFQTLRTNIHYSSFDKEIRTILISSSVPGEGKTTIISNLAIAYARLGKKVLLIDADMRNPKIHKTFSMDNRLGLTNILADKLPYKDIVQNIKELNTLSIITSGPIPPNPVELIESKAFNEFLDELKKDFDLILFDAPPMAAVTDAAVLAHKLDTFLFTTDINVCPRPALKQSFETLSNLKIKVHGYVVNRFIFESRYGYYRYGYKYKYYTYSYGQEKDAKGKQHTQKYIKKDKKTKDEK